jgi:two-component system chemotaxis sensor kinase CheA
MSIDFMAQMRETFRAEALDLLIELDSALLSLEAETGDSALVNRVFRAVHTIKGSGATAGLSHLANFAHRIEEAFDLAREGRLAVSGELIDCALKACDVIRLIVESEVDGETVPGEEEVTAAFTRLLPLPENPAAPQSVQAYPPAEVRAAFEIVFRPHREMFYSGADPVTLLNDLRELGQAHITAHTDQVPALASLDPEHCYLWWEVLLVTDCDGAAIRDVFVFVEDQCDVDIRLREDEGACAVLLGSLSPETFEMFASECADRLEEIERDALTLERGSASRESLDSLFRGVHSIKGNAGLLLGQVPGATLSAGHPLQLLLRVAHATESLLDAYRSENTGPVPGEAIGTAIESCDAMRGLLRSLTHDSASEVVSPALLARLGIHNIPFGGAAQSRHAAFRNTTSQCVEMIEGCFRRLASSGESPAAPVIETYLRGLRTWSAAAQYQNCAELEQPLAQQLSILEAALKTGALLGDEERASLGRAFQAACVVLNRLPSSDEPAPEAPPEVRDRRNQRGPSGPEEKPAFAAAKSAPARGDDASSPSTIRIEQIKLDRLMRVVGELLVARGAFPLLVGKMMEGGNSAGLAKDVKEAGSNISRIADELRSSVMSMRMLPVRTVFQRFPRLVRDLARIQGKEVGLVIEGEGIEMDKTILEQIGDPLVHVIRNAVDHGLEGPEERRGKGKSASGQVTLRASQEAGGVVIEVTDDGRGLDAGALRRKAVEKGLLTQEAAAALSEENAFQLIFMPGLSTAAKLTDVSGRGVGMDVVRNNVHNLQGAIEIRSRAGLGTTLLVKLPTSLMVSKGILLQAGGQEYILPLSNIQDMVKLPVEAIHEYQGQMLAQVRGTIYSVFSLAAMLGLPAAEMRGREGSLSRGIPRETEELSIAIVQTGSLRYGLAVDRFLTEVEVLVKPLAGGLEQCREFQGAAIMGDGRVVLVLNALECHAPTQTVCR